MREELKKMFSTHIDYSNVLINDNKYIEYSDGEVEEYIFQTLREAPSDKRLKYQFLENRIKDWPTKYHFSWERQNILKPVDFSPSDVVLEIGGGTGIITEYLLEKCQEVVTIEGTLPRARCIAERCRNDEKLTLLVSDYNEIIFGNVLEKGSFDKILLIGVLEYFYKYNTNPNATIIDFLNRLKLLLKPGGALVIAIENKLGLKYLLGWKEDHVGIPYYGVESRYMRSGDVLTFGKLELSDLLSKGGFVHSQFYYPFPDYKLPSLVFTREPNEDFEVELVKNLLSKINVPDYPLLTKKGIDFSRVYESIITEKCFGTFSNSFLVVSSHEPQGRSDFFAMSFAVNRRYEYASEISFLSKNGGLVVEKQYNVSEKFQDSQLNLKNENTAQDFIQGASLDRLLHSAFVTRNRLEYTEYLDLYVRFLTNQNITSNYFDLLPQNLIMTESGLVPIDFEEWVPKIKFGPAEIIYRYFVLNKAQLNWLLTKEDFDVCMQELYSKYSLDYSHETKSKVDTTHAFAHAVIGRKDYIRNAENKSRQSILETIKSKIFSWLRRG